MPASGALCMPTGETDRMHADRRDSRYFPYDEITHAGVQMTALPAVIYTSSKADEAFQEALRADIDAAATGTGQPGQVD